jgi:hypothetical protein
MAQKRLKRSTGITHPMAERMNTYDLDGVVMMTPKAESERILPRMLRGGITERAIANILFPAYDLLPGRKLSVENGIIKTGAVNADPDILEVIRRDLDGGVGVWILTSRENSNGTIRKMFDDNDLREVRIKHTGAGKKSKSDVVRGFMEEDPQLKVRHVDDGIGDAFRFVREFGIMPSCFTYFKTWHNAAVASLLRGIVQVADVKELQSARR